MLALIVALSLLMVCNLRMFSLKLHGFSLKESYRQLVLVIASVVFIVLAGVSGLACVIAFYVLMSLLLKEKE